MRLARIIAGGSAVAALLAVPRIGQAIDVPDRCQTPRDGTLSGGFLALDMGLATFKNAAQDRAGIGPGGGAQFRLGAELWDQWVIAFGVGFYAPHDRKPFSEMVVDCTTVDGVNIGCDSSPHSEDSTVTGGYLALETGYQFRFRLPGASLSPGLLSGYLQNVGGVNRSVHCDGCGSVELDVEGSGLYLSPFFRVTFGNVGSWAIIARSQWFITGDLVQITTLGIEYGLP